MMNVPRCRSDYIQAYHNMYQRLSIIFASHICFVEVLHCKPTSFSLLSTKILLKYTSYLRGQERLEMKIPKKLSVCSLKSTFNSNQSIKSHAYTWPSTARPEIPRTHMEENYPLPHPREIRICGGERKNASRRTLHIL